ncbi:MAG TPA: hypothetical protein DEQ74_03250, partial [Wolbachia sp.]|nr:hypothetical protein [Wolbachia sp.]
TNSILLSGLLLVLPLLVFVIAAAPILHAFSKYAMINIIEEQFKGNGKYNEKPSSNVNTGGAFPYNSGCEMGV